MEGIRLYPYHFASADSPVPRSPEWIESEWQRALGLQSEGEVLLVFDEIQKIRGWSETVKALWDGQKRKGTHTVRVLLLGSSALLMERDLSESLAGRFILHRYPHGDLAR